MKKFEELLLRSVVSDNLFCQPPLISSHLPYGIPGAKLIYLPPYSPDYNSIEPSFHSLKSWLRRNEELACDNDAGHPYLIYQAAESFTSKMAIGWIEHSGYTFLSDM
jgi:hypothetical protein